MSEELEQEYQEVSTEIDTDQEYVITPEDEVITEEIQTEEPEQKEQEESPKIDYEDFYNKVTEAISIDGQKLPISGSDDVISLIKRGIDYSAKEQEYSRHNRVLALLSKNNLLDNEDRLAYAIDLVNHDISAAKKLYNEITKENQITYSDLTYDDESAPEYSPSVNARITDSEARLRIKLQQLNNDPHGRTIIQDAQSWDDGSKQIIAQSPETLDLLTQQKQTGVYDTIVKHMQTMQLLNRFGPEDNTFLARYKKAGDELVRMKQNQNQNTSPVTSAQVRAASVQRTSPRSTSARVTITPESVLTASEEEFNKMYKAMMQGKI